MAPNASKPLAPARAGDRRHSGALAPGSASKDSDLGELKQMLKQQMEKQAEIMAASAVKGKNKPRGKASKALRDDASSYAGRQRTGDKIVASKWGKMAARNLLLLNMLH